MAVNGQISAKSVVVSLSGWPDYVFTKEFRKPSIRRIKDFITANGHLSELPTQEEVKRKGIDVGDISSKLVKKVEELTLLLIQEDELVKRMQTQLDCQADEISKLKAKR